MTRIQVGDGAVSQGKQEGREECEPESREHKQPCRAAL